MKKLAIPLVGILLLGSFFTGMLPQNTVNATSVVTVAVCQAGYSAGSLKTAVAVVTGGTLTDTTYQIVKAGDGTQAGSGVMTAFTPSGWTRGETYYKIDFTAFSQTGDYKIVTNGVSSAQFTIAANIWTNYTDEMMEFYRLQRCGVDTNAALPSGFTNRPSSEALHAACHTDDAKKGSESGANADMTGSWHDAGDNNKYAGNMGWVTGALAISFMRRPNATFDYDSNGVPDLLDEAKFGAQALLKIQDAAGMNGAIYDIIDAPNGQYYAWKYPTAETNGIRGDSDDRVGHTRNANPFTYDGAMKTAGGLAAVARAFAARDAAFSDKCKTGAINAYNWALSNTSKTGGHYSISDQNNLRLWAAVQLYLLTNETTYSNWINTYINGLSSISTRPTNYWSLQPIALAEYHPAAGTLQNKIVTLLTTHINNWKNNLVAPFGVTWYNNDGSFGINEPNMSFAGDAIRLYEITGDVSLRDAAINALQWTFGVNPWSISWVSGIGTKYTMHLHSRLDADADTNPSSTIKLPGFMVCGADWSDPMNSNSAHPWYEDRAVASDSNQWRYNEFSISIQYGLVDVIVALSYDGGVNPTPTPVVVTPTPFPVTPTPVRITPTPVRVTPTPVRVTPTPTTPPSGGIKVQFYNQDTSATANQLYLNFRVVNTGNGSIALSNVKMRYYYTVDGAKSQNFYCDWSSVGSSNLTNAFVSMVGATSDADTYIEIGFTSGAGNLAVGGSATIQGRVAKSDWSSFTQTNDYSFNSTATSFVDWTKVTGFVSGALVWGVEPGGNPSTPTPVVVTPTPVPVTPTPVVVTPTPVPVTPTPVIVTPTPVRTATPVVATPTPVAGGYVVTYSMNDWGSGATVTVTIKNNTATAVNGWTLAWTFSGNQMITNMWSATYTQSGASVTVNDAGYNANIPANGGTVSFGFNINYSGTNATPAGFTLNGTACQVQ